jgi:uncharacterized protein
MSEVVCLYHDDCPDGMGAAWALSKRFPRAEFICVRYNESLPKALTGKIVYIVDFCYALSDLIALSVIAEEVHVLDHHKGMGEVIENYNWTMHFLGFDVNKYNAVFDETRSGAKLTWETLLPKYHTPLIIDYISDRDLWHFRLDETEAVMAGLGSYAMDLTTWDELFCWNPDFRNKNPENPHSMPLNLHSHYLAMGTLEREGRVILRKMQIDAKRLISRTERKIVLSGYEVPLVNIPRTLISETLAILAKNQPFAVSYFDSAEFREFSLRSSTEGMNVDVIAKLYGGGGHVHSAGFRVPREHPLAQH